MISHGQDHSRKTVCGAHAVIWCGDAPAASDSVPAASRDFSADSPACSQLRHGQKCSCPLLPSLFFFPASVGTSVPVPLPSQGTAVTGLLVDLSISSTAWGMQVHKQPWMQLLIHRILCLGSRSSGLHSQQCGLVVRPLKSQAAPTSPCRCTLPSPEISVGAESAH